MKKLIACFAFLCLAVGATGAKDFIKDLGDTVNKIDTRKLEYTIPYIPVEKRSTILPKHNICSIAPAGEFSDNFITGNGTLRIQSSGQPYNDVMTYTQEDLYEPKWAETPLPPDLRPYLSRIRQLLLEGKPAEANALVDEAQKKAGFEKYMNFDNRILYPAAVFDHVRGGWTVTGHCGFQPVTELVIDGNAGYNVDDHTARLESDEHKSPDRIPSMVALTDSGARANVPFQRNVWTFPYIGDERALHSTLIDRSPTTVVLFMLG